MGADSSPAVGPVRRGDRHLGVPFFGVDGTYDVSGAQPPDVLLGVLEEAWAGSHPLVPAGGDARLQRRRLLCHLISHGTGPCARPRHVHRRSRREQ